MSRATLQSDIPPGIGETKLLEAEDRGEFGEQDLLAANQSESLIFQIPKEKWGPVEADVINFLDQELNLAESERSEFMRKLARWKLAYHAPVPEGSKNFPIANASNLTVPVIKEAVNTLCAQLIQATQTHRPRWILTDKAPEVEEFVDKVETFLDLSGDREMNLDNTTVDWILETAKLGTGIMEVGYRVEDKLVFKYTEDGQGFKEDVEVSKDGPVSGHIPLSRWWIRFMEKGIQEARWVAKEKDFTWKDLKEKEAQGKFTEVDRLWQQEDPEVDIVEDVQDRVEKTEPLDHDKFSIFEVWMEWPFKSEKDGKLRYAEVVVFYERKTRTVLRRTWNPYWHGKRPFVKIGYMPVEDRFFDMGLCEMLEQLQMLISTKHNQRSDNATIANLKMFVKRRMLKSFNPGDPLYSGKIIEVNDIWNDLREFQAGEIYPSTVNEEQILRDYVNRLSGLNDAIFGSAMPVSRTTAAAQLALLQEQAKRIDLTVSSIRKGMAEIGQFQVDLYFQFGTNKKGVAWMGDKGLWVDAIFSLPRLVSEVGFGIKVSAPSSVENRQVKRENALAMFNLVVQLYEKMLPLVQGLAPDALPVVVREMVAGAQKFMGDVLESFDTSDPDQILAGLAVLEGVLPRAEDLGGMGPVEGGDERAQILTHLERLEGLLRSARSTQDRGTGLPPERNGGRRTAGTQGIPERGPPSIPLGGDFIIQ